MQTQVDIQEIIRKLMAGQPIDGWELHPTQAPGYSSPESGGPTLAGDSTPIGASYLDKDKGMWSAYDMNGDLQRTSAESTGASTFKKFLGDAAMIAGAGAGLGGFGEMLNGGSFLAGAQAPFNAVFGLGDAALGGADALTSSLGGGGFDAAAGAFNPGLDALGFGSGAGSLGMGGLGEAATSFGLDPSLFGGIAAGGAAGGGSFLDKAGNFLSDPGNLLKTIGTAGGLWEAFKGKDEGDFTQTTNKTLDPRIDSAVFGADGKGGLLGQLQGWAAQNPTGQNQTMRDAQTGLRSLLMDPAVMTGYRTQGGTGLGLMNRGVAPNPWLTPKVGG